MGSSMPNAERTIPTLDDLPSSPEGQTGWPWTEQTDLLPETRPEGEPWPKISVVTPSYNQDEFIEETIRSILLQGYPNLEYIVIDGGSTDESVEIIEKYDPWIDYWVSEEDRGQSHAINKGLERCTGEIFNWINSDDLLARGALEFIGDNMCGADILAGGGWCFNESNKWERATKDLSFEGLVAGYYGDGTFIQQGVWLDTEKVKRCGGVDENLEYCMDQDLYARYIREFKNIKYTDKKLAHFRHHDESKTNTSQIYFLKDHIKIAKKVKHETEKEGTKKFCTEVIKKCKSRIKVDRIKYQKSKTKLKKVWGIINVILESPKYAISRYSLGSIRKIILDN
ncbi:glycosyltransferase family 2 protein [Salinibacter ruber]|uniref:glycosyltransferase family 2 protein n=1 Tax=Salinibacter ruber TaxID=146919 RepID=UPI00216812E6|nr:glycosyltransferase family 2 protein [Salinibacter ruber]MCS3824356.1 glycosyltransferase involved in cell wall biosynthesis [Salinibacter ruber]